MSVRQSNYRYLGKPSAVAVDERQHSLNSLLLARAARHSQNQPDESLPGGTTFREDFLMEHSRLGQRADSKVFAGCF